MAEVNPDEGADKNSQCRDKERKCHLLLRAELVVDQSRGIDAHERDESSEVKQFGSLLIAEQKATRYSNRSDDQHVIPRNTVSTIDCTKDPGWQ